MIDGKNFFSGETAPGNPFLGTYGVTVDNQKDWEIIWDQAGFPPPGKLPEGAIALFHMTNRQGLRSELHLLKVEKAEGCFRLSWEIHQTPMEDNKKYGQFTVILLPGDGKTPVEAGYRYRTLPSASEKRAEAARLLAEDIASFSPGLKRRLPVPRSLKRLDSL